MEEKVITELEGKIGNDLRHYWERLPEPKPVYSRWYYRDDGPYDMLQELIKSVKAAKRKEDTDEYRKD